MGSAVPNFMGKTFADDSKTTKFMNVFSLENFLPYNFFKATYCDLVSVSQITLSTNYIDNFFHFQHSNYIPSIL